MPDSTAAVRERNKDVLYSYTRLLYVCGVLRNVCGGTRVDNNIIMPLENNLNKN